MLLQILMKYVLLKKRLAKGQQCNHEVSFSHMLNQMLKITKANTIRQILLIFSYAPYAERASLKKVLPMRCLHENMILRQFTSKLMVMLQIQDATSMQYLNTLSLGRPPLAAGFDSCLLARPSRTSFVSRSPVSNPLEPSRTLSNLLEQV